MLSREKRARLHVEILEDRVVLNAAPVAVNDGTYNFHPTQTTPSLAIAASGVLSNDTDADLPSDMLSANLSTDVNHGTLTLYTDGSFSYMPTLGYVGSDSFTYYATDMMMASSNIATVSISVNNTAPSAVNDTYYVHQGAFLDKSAANGVLSNDTDAESDTLTAAVISPVSHGTLNLSSDGSFSYYPTSGYAGSDNFTYEANDSITVSATRTVTINVTNTAPVASDYWYNVHANATLTAGTADGLLSNATDADGDTLTASTVDPSHGMLMSNDDGSFSYYADMDYTGTDSFTYQANDGAQDSAAATVYISIGNQAPVVQSQSFSVNLSQVLDSIDPLASDGDGDPLTIYFSGSPSHGQLTLETDGSLTYAAPSDWSGTETFNIWANDGTVDSNLAALTFNIGIDQAPVAVNDGYGLQLNGSITIGAANGLLANDTDADGDPLTASLISGPANGSLTFNNDGSFIYTPTTDFIGNDTFTYVANDGLADSNTATVTLNVHDDNQDPVADDDSYTASHNTPLTVSASGVLANDTDADGDLLTASVVSGPTNGSLTLNTDGSFTYTPNINFIGSDSFTYAANDGTTDSNTATVTISVTDNAPSAGDWSYTILHDQTLTVSTSVLDKSTDVDGDSLTAVLVIGPSNGTLTLNSDGTFTYMPGSQFAGTDSFTYEADDGLEESNVAVVSIAVTNNAPMAGAAFYSTLADQTLSVSATGVLGYANDLDGDGMAAQLVTAPTDGILTLNTDGSFLYEPNSSFTGNDSFTYEASDGLASSAPALVTINVGSNPVANDDQYGGEANQALTVAAADGVMRNDANPQAQQLTAALVSGPSNGTVSLRGCF